jgi:hypothetical protein
LKEPSGKTDTFYAIAQGKEVEGFDAVNFLDWGEHFIEMGESDDNRKLFCEQPYEIIKTIQENDEKAQQVIEAETGLFKEGMNCSDFLEIYSTATIRYRPIVEALRKLVCRHPLEWDQGLFKRGDFPNMSQKNFDRLVAEEGLRDIWKEGKDQGIKGAIEGADKDNSFWFAHPVYFIRHLDNAGLLSKNVDNLILAQDRIVALKCLKPYIGRGMYDRDDAVGSTFCNHATFLTIQAVDDNYKQFIGNPNLYKSSNHPPYWVLASLEEGDFKEKYRDYEHRISNFWCDILAEQAAHSETTGICKIEAPEAQAKANLGYVVVAAWKNPEKGEGNSPHYATVRPGGQYSVEEGPKVANVGNTNNKDATAKGGFGETILDEIKYYYNRNQVFRNPIDDKNIKILEEGGHL